MHINDFANAKLDDLALFTGIHKTSWSRYLNSRTGIAEATLNRIANKFGVEPDVMLSAIQSRRKNPPRKYSGSSRGQAA
jgi:transcriptional regulator with XRE-family HTH domain